ncbi:MAG: alanine:cation symporter family protein, partial [FCB group bacterium]|nr:alanine:cation symporter family protein [FCB group bacterium]
GPMYYIKKGFEGRPFLGKVAAPLAGAFAFFGAWTALFGTGNMMQANSMALAFNQQLGIPFIATGAVASILVGLVIIGGIKRIGKTAEILVPAMILLYFSGALVILFMNFSKIPGAFSWIFQSAFSPQAAVGGFIGHSVKMALQFGVRRGLLSNESGLGSTPIAHAASKAKNPVRQGMIAMFDTFIDTLVVCTITALVILVTGAYLPGGNAAGEQLTSSALTAQAFSTGLHSSGGTIVAICSALFGYSTLIGWYYYGERCFEYLFGLKKIKFYKVIYVCLTFIGAILQGEYLQIVWDMGDLSNGLMAVPNLIGLICLSGVVYRITEEY